MQPPRRDLSGVAGNPTNSIQVAYADLMGIQDPGELSRAALELVEPLVGVGFSPENFRKFRGSLMQAAQRGLRSVQSYLTNYMLKGSGLGVESDQVVAIGSMLTEDVDVFRVLDEGQLALKGLVESFGFFVVVEG